MLSQNFKLEIFRTVWVGKTDIHSFTTKQKIKVTLSDEMWTTTTDIKGIMAR